jgi:type IV pilus assembly protein PilA
VWRAVRIGLFCVVALAVFIVALPDSNRRYPRSETSPIKAITTIHTAQVQYYSAYNRYAASLPELGPPASGADGPSAAGLIERDLASGNKGGYKYALTPTPGGYTIAAMPDQHVTSGGRTFLSDQSMGIHVHFGSEPATMRDPLLGE